MVFVTNQPTTMCCGQPRGKCTCHAGHAPPVENRSGGIGLPTYDFDQPQAAPNEATSTVVTNANAPSGGIGLPVYDFEQVEQVEQVGAVSNNASGGHAPLGLPGWDG